MLQRKMNDPTLSKSFKIFFSLFDEDDIDNESDVDERVVADLYSNPCGAKYLRQPINKVTLTT